MPLLPPRHLDTVAFIESYRKGQPDLATTGFFCRHRPDGDESQADLFLVATAEAARADLDATLVFGRHRRTGRTVFAQTHGYASLAEGRWLSDPAHNLAVLPVNPAHLQLRKWRFHTFVSAASQSITRRSAASALPLSAMRRQRIGEGDDVLILGLDPEPDGLRRAPLVRRGVIARIQDCYREQSQTFLVEATTFDSDKGSPVVMKPQRPTTERSRTDPAGKLIGIVTEFLPNPWGPVRTTHDGRPLDVRLNSGLVRVTPVDALQPLLAAARAGRR